MLTHALSYLLFAYDHATAFRAYRSHAMTDAALTPASAHDAARLCED